MNVCLLCPLD